jgi:hypothetical protein
MSCSESAPTLFEAVQSGRNLCIAPSALGLNPLLLNENLRRRLLWSWPFRRKSQYMARSFTMEERSR